MGQIASKQLPGVIYHVKSGVLLGGTLPRSLSQQRQRSSNVQNKEEDGLRMCHAVVGQITSKQLRDDLMTMLIAGHETTAAVLTWTLYCLTDRPDVLRRMQQEVRPLTLPEWSFNLVFCPVGIFVLKALAPSASHRLQPCQAGSHVVTIYYSRMTH